MAKPKATVAAPDDRSIDTVRTVAEVRARVSAWRAAGETVGLVPTMGALHEGHLSLVRLSLARAGRTCVSLFVNPTQFGPDEDLRAYPRDEAADAARLAALGAHLLFAPGTGEMYREGNVTEVSVPGLGDCLEGEHRPGFFTGVATVVAKLLMQVQPDMAVFGEKDYQQLQVIKRMVKDLDIPVRIEAAPTVREADGLAMASRNAYLSAAERAAAPALFRTISAVAGQVAGGADAGETAAWGEGLLLKAGFARVDYLTVRDAETLEPVDRIERPARVLAAAWLGEARLIDNVAVQAGARKGHRPA